MTAAEELHAAAEKLRTLAATADERRNAPWQAGAAGSVISPREGGYHYVTGYTISEGPEVARYIAAMHPGVGAALAVLLDAAADHVRAQYVCCDNGEHMCSEAPALALTFAVARAILGQPASLQEAEENS